METTSGDSRAEKRVRDGNADISNQTGLPNIGSLGIEYDPSISTEGLEHPRQEEGLADTVIEDEINPDDAPEVAWDDTNEEVCINSVLGLCEWLDLRLLIQGEENNATMLGQLGCPKTSADVSALV
jgi:hypothetical protein